MTTTIYPKTYATVTGHKPETGAFFARTEAGDVLRLEVRWRNGKGSSCSIVPGRRIKVYQRPGRLHPNFRMVGA